MFIAVPVWDIIGVVIHCRIRKLQQPHSFSLTSKTSFDSSSSLKKSAKVCLPVCLLLISLFFLRTNDHKFCLAVLGTLFFFHHRAFLPMSQSESNNEDSQNWNQFIFRIRKTILKGLLWLGDKSARNPKACIVLTILLAIGLVGGGLAKGKFKFARPVFFANKG